ncbi:MAG: fibronectin type III domain-containing protein, partial [Anaerolineae bacterium]
MREKLLLCHFALLILLTLGGETAAQEPPRPSPIILWSSQGPVAVERAPVVTTAYVPPERLLRELLRGPTAQEKAEGLWTAIPEGTGLAAYLDQLKGTVIVRLQMPQQALNDLTHQSFEIIVDQIGHTLMPVGWSDLRIQVQDPDTGDFVPLANFLPEIVAPRKETPWPGAAPQVAPADTGQPPAPGQGQPQGALSGKTIYVSAGHGWEWNSYVYGWRTQRPPYPNPPYAGPIIEDHNNAEAVDQYLLQYLWNAGAMVWPVRERDMNAAEAIVDDSAAVLYGSDWTAAAGGYEGHCHEAQTVTGLPTATATWSTSLPADGHYAVYVWFRPGSNPTDDAEYTVHHSGGETSFTVDQGHHGHTWHYIGTYGFLAGGEARVTLTNQSSVAGRTVVADAVRFGGGTFDSLVGIDTDADHPPSKPWWEVAAYYFSQKMGMRAAYGDVTARPIYARWEHFGTGDDAVYVSWHTNGVSGYQTHSRGTLSIMYNGSGGSITPGSELLRNTIHDELLNDIRSGWDATWPGSTLRMNLGELRELWDDDIASDPSQDQIPGALFEIAYHDHPDDTDALKEPTFNMLAARALYQGIVKYFEARDGINLTLLPEPPTHLSVKNIGGGQAQLTWQPSPADVGGLLGDPATRYRVYTGTNGIGWSNGVDVPGGTEYVVGGLSAGQLLYVRVTATNDGGESFPTETLAVRAGDSPGTLLVNGFDRLNGSMAVLDADPVEGDNMRMLLDRMNRYDYVIQHAEGITHAFDSASNEAVQSGSVDLTDYTVVDWILGEESAPD